MAAAQIKMRSTNENTNQQLPWPKRKKKTRVNTLPHRPRLQYSTAIPSAVARIS